MEIKCTVCGCRRNLDYVGTSFCYSCWEKFKKKNNLLQIGDEVIPSVKLKEDKD